MVENNCRKGSVTDRPPDFGTLTRERVHARTRELAVIAGRSAADVSQTDYEQAKREFAGESNENRPDAIFDAPSSGKRKKGCL